MLVSPPTPSRAAEMTYLNHRSLYAAAAAIIMCADADLPASDGRTAMFRIFPVKKNLLVTWSGSSAKLEGGLLCSDKSTGGVDGHVSVESSQRVCERVIGRTGRPGGGYEPSTAIQSESFGAETYHSKRLHLGYPAIFSLL